MRRTALLLILFILVVRIHCEIVLLPADIAQLGLFILYLITFTAGKVIIHVAHPFNDTQLESISVSKWTSVRGPGSIISGLHFFNTIIHKDYLLTCPPEYFVQGPDVTSQCVGFVHFPQRECQLVNPHCQHRSTAPIDAKQTRSSLIKASFRNKSDLRQENTCSFTSFSGLQNPRFVLSHFKSAKVRQFRKFIERIPCGTLPATHAQGAYLLLGPPHSRCDKCHGAKNKIVQYAWSCWLNK